MGNKFKPMSFRIQFKYAFFQSALGDSHRLVPLRYMILTVCSTNQGASLYV